MEVDLFLSENGRSTYSCLRMWNWGIFLSENVELGLIPVWECKIGVYSCLRMWNWGLFLCENRKLGHIPVWECEIDAYSCLRIGNWGYIPVWECENRAYSCLWMWNWGLFHSENGKMGLIFVWESMTGKCVRSIFVIRKR